MDIRTFYSIGNYSSVISASSNNNNNNNNSEAISLIFKSILLSNANNSDISKCTQFISSQSTVSDLLKRTLLLWSKAVLKPNSGGGEVMALQELASKAHEAAEIDPEERDQVILTVADALLRIDSLPEAHSVLKLLKASNLDCQVMFIEILIKLGQVKMAQERLEKMKNIPEWKDDVRFLLIEALLGLYTPSQDQDNDTENSFTSRFTVKDSLYSYQELIQVHGPTPNLLLHLAASYVLLGKFAEAQSTLLQIDPNSPDAATIKSLIQSNFILTAALLNSPNLQLK